MREIQGALHCPLISQIYTQNSLTSSQEEWQVCFIFKNSVYSDIVSLNIDFVLENSSIDPDKILHLTAFYLAQHWLQTYPFTLSSKCLNILCKCTANPLKTCIYNLSPNYD